jgi:THO complex subunit 5
LDGWSPIRALPVPGEASSPTIIDKEEHVQESMDVDVIENSGVTKDEPDSMTEDGELPTLLPKTAKFDHSTQASLISKSIIPSLNKVRSQSFKKVDDSSDFLLDTDSDFDEPAQIESEHENIISDYLARKSLTWMDSGVKEFLLVLSRKTNVVERNVNLEAKVKKHPLFIYKMYSRIYWHFHLDFFFLTDQDQYGISSKASAFCTESLL